MGRLSARILVASDVVSEIVIAGRNLETARRTAAELGGKATALQVDATDEGRLASLAGDSDIVVNAAGPDFRVAVPALRAAIRAGTHYCDINCDGPATEKALELSPEAQASNVTALIGIGLAGLSNLMMVHASRQLDRAEEIRLCHFFPVVGWGDPQAALADWRKAGHADASWQQTMRFIAGKARLFRDGRWVDVDPVEDAVRVTLPVGSEVIAHPVGAAEPITLPRSLPDVRSVSVVMSLFPPQLNDLYCELGRRIARGELDESAAAMAFYERLVAEPDRWLTDAERYGSDWVEWVETVGTRHGRRARYRCWPTAPLVSTSRPLATAALKILRGEIRTPGVFPPEACLDPTSFFQEVAQHATEKPPSERLLEESFEVLE